MPLDGYYIVCYWFLWQLGAIRVSTFQADNLLDVSGIFEKEIFTTWRVKIEITLLAERTMKTRYL